VTSRLGTGMSLTFFYGVQWVKNGARNRVKLIGSGQGSPRSKLFLPYEHAVLLKEITNMLERTESWNIRKAIKPESHERPESWNAKERRKDRKDHRSKY
jgi:hypothetical protein